MSEAVAATSLPTSFHLVPPHGSTGKPSLVSRLPRRCPHPPSPSGGGSTHTRPSTWRACLPVGTVSCLDPFQLPYASEIQKGPRSRDSRDSDTDGANGVCNAGKAPSGASPRWRRCVPWGRRRLHVRGLEEAAGQVRQAPTPGAGRGLGASRRLSLVRVAPRIVRDIIEVVVVVASLRALLGRRRKLGAVNAGSAGCHSGQRMRESSAAEACEET